ncbi:MAG TPA: signal peptidase II, partial [Kribbella sp.]
MQRTPGTPLNDPAPPPEADETATPEPADDPSAGSPSSTPAEPTAEDRVPAADSAASSKADAAASGGEAVGRSWKWTVVFGGVGLVVLFLDQLTKALALAHLTPGEPVNVIGTLL